MIDTDLKIYEKDLIEVINFFPNSENLRIRHRFKESENKVVNTITVDGNTLAYGNLIPKTDSELVKKRLIKRYAKLSLYKALSKHFGIELPWGALTGIRPTKLAYSQIEETGEFEEFFRDTMKVSERKINLTAKVLQTQKGLYEKNSQNTDLFVFIPFCPSRCKYCSFITSDIKTAQKHVDEYVDVLIKDILASKSLINNLRSIYIGGGTPVSLSNEQLERVLCAIDEINTGVEYTVEAGRPDRITKGNLEILSNHKVTRICINPQTFNDKTLKVLGRNHTSDDVIEKYNLAKGKFIINMDLIAGLPNESLEDFKYSLDKAISLRPDNLTVHSLCVKRGSYLCEETKRIDCNAIDEMIEYSQNKLEEAGYKPYYLYRQKYMAGNLENVGYTLEGKACIYNIDTMEEITDTVACGANAISKKVNFKEEKILRSAPPKDVLSYINKIDRIIEEKKELFKK